MALCLIAEVQLARLQDLGFSMEDCRKALLCCQGELRYSKLVFGILPATRLSDCKVADGQAVFPSLLHFGLVLPRLDLC